MAMIAEAFQSNLKLSKHHNPVKYYHKIAIGGRVRSQGLINYLNQYPLMSSKRLDYQAWETTHELFRKGSHLKPEGLTMIKQLKEGMNTKRTYLNWSHLEGWGK